MSIKINNIQSYRDEYILSLNDSNNKSEYEKKHADSLFDLGLTMYSKEYSFKSAVYNGFACSHIDETLSLHPEQMEVLNLIDKNSGMIFSAPTSFGKTFVVFEYIARNTPDCVVLIVPTLALVDEYKQKIIKKYKNSFSNYSIYTSIDTEKKYDFSKKNLFILTHDRVVSDNVVNTFSKIDFLVIDEVYKLKTDLKDNRVLILNLAYKFLMEKSEKYLLLAPFLKEVNNIDKLNKKPIFYSSNFAPVVNKVIERNIYNETERNTETVKIINELNGTKRLVYFPTVTSLNKFINMKFKLDVESNNNYVLNEFINWASTEIHEEWSILKALKKGILVHHGQLPLGVRILQLELFNNPDSGYDIMLCTSTLLEGVNTACENIIITKPARNSTQFDAFDFFNLVGRTGRLCKYYLGTAYYIRGENDREYNKAEALKSIEFELTDNNSIDMDINSEKYTEHPEFLFFLDELGISYDDYIKHFATQFRFATVKAMYDRFSNYKSDLYNEINNMLQSDKPTKLNIIREMYKIMEENTYNYKLKTYIINVLTYKKNKSVHDVIEQVRKSFNKIDNIDSIISEVLKLKNSYIEHDFYKKTKAILYFMWLDNASDESIELIEEKILKVIEKKYFMNSSCKKMLKDMGIYEKDVNIIANLIGENINSIDELILKINEDYKNIISKISIISKFVVYRLIK